ncbi:hypothetical protein TWF506_004422 [Arthrobotrys conoides]|uniref:Uncharacterized protein n=1 Tax=Arthrobotrys conoides TaxID=74498 RepID=A0AAN8N0N7_9PEZI
MASVLGPYEQDYAPLKLHFPIIPTTPQRASKPAPYCIKSFLENRPARGLLTDKKFNWPATCDTELMKEAVTKVPRLMDDFFSWWVEKVRLQTELPSWNSWYCSLVADLHRYRHWHNEDPIRWEFCEIAAALDPKYAALRKTSVWVWRPEMIDCIKDLQEFLSNPDNMRIASWFGWYKHTEFARQPTAAQRERGALPYRLTCLCLRSPEDPEVIQYDEEWEFEWGEYVPYQEDY